MNVLFLTHRLPYAPNRGDRIRAYHLLECLSSFADVSLFSLVHDPEEQSRVREVRAARVDTALVPRTRNLVAGALGLPSSRPLTHALLSAPDATAKIASLVAAQPPDVVLVYCSGMAQYALRAPLHRVPFVLDMVDVDSRKWQELGARTSGWRGWVYRREARTLAAFERRAALAARQVLVVSDREADVMRELAPDARTMVLGNGVDVSAFASPQPPAELPVVVFCGVMDYEPNVEAVRWFADHVWPAVRQARPDARFLVVGANPPQALVAHLAGDASIEITGRVEAVQPYLWRAAVSVAPLHVARGLQNKVLEALSAGLPVVVTPAVMGGLPAAVRSGVVEAGTAETFAAAVLHLLSQTAGGRRALAASANVAAFTWQHQLQPLEAILKNACRNRT